MQQRNEKSMYSYIRNSNNKVIKLYSWIAFDVGLCGLFTYNWIVLQISAFTTALDAIEKLVLTLCTTVFAIYRIYILHMDAERRRIDLQEKKFDLHKRKEKEGAV
jgi:hypothetical protein